MLLEKLKIYFEDYVEALEKELNVVCNNFKPKQQEEIPEPERGNNFNGDDINDIWVLSKTLKKIKNLKSPENKFEKKHLK